MIKTCLAYFGLFCLLLLLFAMLGTAYVYMGPRLAANAGKTITVNQPPRGTQAESPAGSSSIDKKSLIDQLPVSTLPPTPTLVPDPAAYRSEVMVRAKRFGAALDSLNQENGKLGQNPELLKDPQWQQGMQAILDEFAASAQALGEVQPVPAEYQSIQDWLVKVGPEAQQLKENYRSGMESGDLQSFRAAGDNLNHIREDMLQAQSETVKAGWPQ